MVEHRLGLEERQRQEAVRTARALALAGLPKRRLKGLQELSRTLRVGAKLWLRVVYTAQPGHELAFGADRFVLAGIQHLAIEQDSPVVYFDRVATLLKLFGLHEDGRTLSRFRQRFHRLSGLSIRLLFGDSEEGLDAGNRGKQMFIITEWSLPKRGDLERQEAGQILLPGGHPYGVKLSGDFWEHLQDSSKRLLVPLELLKLFVDRPMGWDYLCFLVARCGAARSSTKIPHEALLSLFRDTKRQTDREIVHRLREYHREIMLATGHRLNAELIEDGYFPSTGGRCRKRWALKVGPSRSLLKGDVIPIARGS